LMAGRLRAGASPVPPLNSAPVPLAKVTEPCAAAGDGCRLQFFATGPLPRLASCRVTMSVSTVSRRQSGTAQVCVIPACFLFDVVGSLRAIWRSEASVSLGPT
jgi:hypothetical protein